MGRMSRLAVSIVVAAALLGPLLASQPASSGPLKKAGIVVQYGKKVRSDCVKFRGDISGIDLVRMSRFAQRIATFSFGDSVCWLDGKGCKTKDPDRCSDCNPADGTFDGKFWGYFVQDKGDADPDFSSVGASDRTLAHGSIDYWLWGDGSGFPKEKKFKRICRNR